MNVLPFIAAGLLLGLNSSAVVSSAVSSSVDYGQFPDASIVSMGHDSDGNFYVYWKQGAAAGHIPNSIYLSGSLTVDASSVTGYKEYYRDYDLVYSSVVDSAQSVGCYRVEGSSFTGRRIFVNSLLWDRAGEDQCYYPVTTEYIYDSASDSFSSKVFSRVQVTDMVAGWWGVFSGDSTFFPSDKPRAYQEHYVAFNTDNDANMDELLRVDIQAHWEYSYGRTGVVGTTDYLGYVDLPTTACPTTVAGPSDASYFSVLPGTKTYVGRSMLFGIPLETVTYSFPVIGDTSQLTSDSFYLSKAFGKTGLNKVSDAILDSNGKPKYRWIVNYNENDYTPDFYPFQIPMIGGMVWTTAYEVSRDRPMIRATDATVVYLTWRKDGMEISSVVVSPGVPSGEDPEDPYVPDVEKNPLWLILMIVFVVAALSVLCFFVQPVWKVVKGILKSLVFLLMLVVEVLWIVLVWWWLALLAKASHKPVPRAWIWKRKEGGS